MVSVDLVTPDIRAQFRSQDEHVMYSESTKKHKAFGGSDELDRIYIMTTHNIYTYKMRKNKTYKLTRFYQIQDVGAIILSSENDNDFMLFFYLSEDLHLSSNNRKELLDLLTLRNRSSSKGRTISLTFQS